MDFLWFLVDFWVFFIGFSWFLVGFKAVFNGFSWFLHGFSGFDTAIVRVNLFNLIIFS